MERVAWRRRRLNQDARSPSAREAADSVKCNNRSVLKRRNGGMPKFLSVFVLFRISRSLCEWGLNLCDIRSAAGLRFMLCGESRSHPGFEGKTHSGDLRSVLNLTEGLERPEPAMSQTSGFGVQPRYVCAPVRLGSGCRGPKIAAF
jgi:hypothetical protein